MTWWFNVTQRVISHTATTLSKMQNGFCMRHTVALDYLWVIFFCHGKYIVSCSRGWKKNSLSSCFNEVPNVILILLSRANSKKLLLKPDCPSVHFRVIWKQVTIVKGSLRSTRKNKKNNNCSTEKSKRWAVNWWFGLLQPLWLATLYELWRRQRAVIRDVYKSLSSYKTS